MSSVWSLLPACMLKDGMEIARQLRQIQRQKRRDMGRLKSLKVQAERSGALRKDRGETPLHLTYPEALPITARKDEIVRAIREHPVVIVAGETGSGKTTQLPKMCLEGRPRCGGEDCVYSTPARGGAIGVAAHCRGVKCRVGCRGGVQNSV